MSPIPNIRALAIDLDGTLLDTIPDLCRAVNHVLIELGHDALPLDLIKSFVGKGLSNHVYKSLGSALKREPTNAEQREAFNRYQTQYAAHLTDCTTLYPGVMEALEVFKRRGLPMAVVTNKSGRFTVPLLEHFGLMPFIDHIVSGDTLTTSKPDPGMMFYAAGLMGVCPREMLMIGDSGNDSRAAQAAGSPVVLLSYGYTEGENLADLHPNAIVDTFTAIPALLADDKT